MRVRWHGSKKLRKSFVPAAKKSPAQFLHAGLHNQDLAVAGASCVAAAFPIRVAICAVVAAVVAIILLNCVVYVHDANARVAGAFLLRDSRHGFLLSSVFEVVVRMREDMLDHNLQNAVNAGICHCVENLFAAPF